MCHSRRRRGVCVGAEVAPLSRRARSRTAAGEPRRCGRPRSPCRGSVGQGRAAYGQDDAAREPLRWRGCTVTGVSARRGTVIVSTAVAAAVAVVVTTVPAWATTATTSRERPRGAVEDCSTAPGWGRRDEFTRRANLVVGPLALRNATPMLAYAPTVSGNKVILSVKGGHRVTLELSRHTRLNTGLGFGPYPEGEVRFRDTRRIVTFIACRRGERTGRFDGWPVTSWVGFLLARSPMCVPLLVWVDDEVKPRRTVIRFGVRDCG